MRRLGIEDEDAIIAGFGDGERVEGPLEGVHAVLAFVDGDDDPPPFVEGWGARGKRSRRIHGYEQDRSLSLCLRLRLRLRLCLLSLKSSSAERLGK
jgi:hypothetical protein